MKKNSIISSSNQQRELKIIEEQIETTNKSKSLLVHYIEHFINQLLQIVIKCTDKLVFGSQYRVWIFHNFEWCFKGKISS